MERLTYRDSDGRAWLTNKGMHIYCSTQATADMLCWYEELLLKEHPAIPTKWIYDYIDKLEPDTAERNAVVQMFVAWRKEEEKT